VIAPAGVYRTWETAIREHVAEDLQRRLFVYTWQSSKAKATKEKVALEEFLESTDPRVLLMNVEALSSVKDAKQLCFDFLRNSNKAMIAVDESTIIKTPKTQRTKFVLQLAMLARFRRILSGLPTPRSPLDLYCQMQFLNPRILGYSSYWAFRSACAITKRIPVGGRSIEIIVGFHPRFNEWLQEKIKPHSFRVPFRPKIPSTYTIREVGLTEEQRRIYRDIVTYATAKLSEEAHVTATIIIAQILRLHQVLCGHTRDEQGNVHEIPEQRTAELLELLEDYSGKAVIWCSYDYSVNKVTQALRKEYGEGSVARFWGGNTATR
jgi:hypothetical protein